MGFDLTATNRPPRPRNLSAMTLRLPDDLMHSALYPHDASAIECIETHASWVILAGAYAYKIKKPVNFGFLDFSTPTLRRAACEEELRLNRRTAPRLYEALVAIGDQPVALDDPRQDAVEYAVRMKRFQQSALLATVLDHHDQPLHLLESLAQHIADFHAAAGIAGAGSEWGSSASIWQPAQDNLRQLRESTGDASVLADVAAVDAWMHTTFARLEPVLAQRQRGGRVRECHGDLHLGNIIVLDDTPVLFDALEFNPSLRWIDVMSDIAFLVMDLQARGRAPESWHLLNAWLERNGDYEGLQVLPWYLCYRAMVRAKVAALRLPQLPPQARASALEECRRYTAMARHYTLEHNKALVITHGISGSGKTTHSQRLADHFGLIRIRADVERKRLFGLAATASSQGVTGGIYHDQANRQTQERLEQLARAVLAAGYPVLVDATFIRREPRDRMKTVADAMQVSWFVLGFTAAPDVMRERARRRSTLAQDASEANADVVNLQLAALEPLTPEEQSHALIIATDTQPDWSSLFPAFLTKTRLRSISP